MTPTQQQTPNPWGNIETQEQARPRILSIGRITGLSESKTTGGGDGNYEVANIIVTPTRGSKKPLPSIMFRNEMFSAGHFNPKVHYGKFNESQVFEPNPLLAGIPVGKSKPLGQSFLGVFQMNCWPKTYTVKKDNPKRGLTAGTVVINQQTALSAIAGGTWEGFTRLGAAFSEAVSQIPTDRPLGDLGFPELSSEEIVEVLRLFISNSGVKDVEQAFEMTQRRDQNGELTDFFEVSRFYGPFTSDLAASLQKKVDDTINKPVNERWVRSYSV